MATSKEPNPYAAMGNKYADLLIGDAQMSMADPKNAFGNEDIQALKSDIFAMSLLERDGGGRLRSVYGPSLDAMEASLSKRADRQIATTRAMMFAEKQKFDMMKARKEAQTELENERKYGEIANTISSVLQSPMSTQEKSQIIFNTFTSEPQFMQSTDGQKLFELSTKQLTGATTPGLKDAQSKVLADAISSSSPEAINSVMDSQGIPKSDPVRSGALLSARKKQSEKAQKDRETAYDNRLKALGEYADDALSEPTYQSVLTFAEQLIPDAKDLGLTELQAFKDLTAWAKKPAPSDDEMTYGPGFAAPIANIRSLLFEMSKQSSIPGARRTLRRNPSMRSSSLDTLGIPNRQPTI